MLRRWFSWVSVCVLGLGNVACSAAGDTSPSLGDSQNEIINGDPYPPEQSGMVMIHHGGPGNTNPYFPYNTCSGTLLNNDTVLTARHCVTFDRTISGSLETDLTTFQLIMGSQTRNVTRMIAMAATFDTDAALLVADDFFAMPGGNFGYWMDPWPSTNADLVGRNVFCYGYGLEDPADPFSAQTLRTAGLSVSSSTATRIYLPANASGQALWHGDSGGGCLAYTPAGFFVTGVSSTCGTSPGSTCSQIGPQVVLPFTSTNYTRGWVHTATTSNILVNTTRIDNALTNDKPNALVYVTPSFNPGGGAGVTNAHEVGVFYASGRWRIFNQDGASMTTNAKFHVSVGGGFLHQVTAANRSAYITTIDNPELNGKPNIGFVVTQNWNPGGVGGVYNNHPIGTWYNGFSGRWTIYNQDLVDLPLNAAFNVRIERSYAVRPTLRSGSSAYIDDPDINGQPNAKVFAVSNFSPFNTGGVYNPHPTGVWYSSLQGKWAVYNLDGATMPLNAGFNILVRP